MSKIKKGRIRIKEYITLKNAYSINLLKMGKGNKNHILINLQNKVSPHTHISTHYI